MFEHKYKYTRLALILILLSISACTSMKNLQRLQNEIKETTFPKDVSQIESKYDDNPMCRAAFLKGYIHGYNLGYEGINSTFPFGHEDARIQPAMLNGFYVGQFDGFDQMRRDMKERDETTPNDE